MVRAFLSLQFYQIMSESFFLTSNIPNNRWELFSHFEFMEEKKW